MTSHYTDPHTHPTQPTPQKQDQTWHPRPTRRTPPHYKINLFPQVHSRVPPRPAPSRGGRGVRESAGPRGAVRRCRRHALRTFNLLPHAVGKLPRAVGGACDRDPIAPRGVRA
ncbi:hypothetical protein GCM10023259_020270 [Thermocatellispora tengchongensis]